MFEYLLLKVFLGRIFSVPDNAWANDIVSTFCLDLFKKANILVTIRLHCMHAARIDYDAVFLRLIITLHPQRQLTVLHLQPFEEICFVLEAFYIILILKLQKRSFR